MSAEPAVPMVRCHLDSVEDDPHAVRYVPASEFELWRFLMETRHRRAVTVDEVSVWVPDAVSDWYRDLDVLELAPVLRIRFEKPGPDGTPVPVERFFPAETYREARAAMLAHFDPRCRWTVTAAPGYFVPAACTRREPPTSLSA